MLSFDRRDNSSWNSRYIEGNGRILIPLQSISTPRLILFDSLLQVDMRVILRSFQESLREYCSSIEGISSEGFPSVSESNLWSPDQYCQFHSHLRLETLRNASDLDPWPTRVLTLKLTQLEYQPDYPVQTRRLHISLCLCIGVSNLFEVAGRSFLQQHFKLLLVHFLEWRFLHWLLIGWISSSHFINLNFLQLIHEVQVLPVTWYKDLGALCCWLIKHSQGEQKTRMPLLSLTRNPA